jgi:small subunit ribosomal protein S18
LADELKRRRSCKFCEQRAKAIDYKDERLLRRFISDRGRILPRRITGNCARHQRQLTLAIKKGRHLAMLPFTQEITR